MNKYFLTTKRLGFRNWLSKDFDLAVTLWGDPEVTKYIGGPFGKEEIQKRLEHEIASFASYKVQYWPLFSLEDDEFAGCGGLRPYKIEKNIYELGIHLIRKCQGKGYGNEAGRRIIKYGFSDIKASALFAGHNPHNEASRGMLKKLNFRYSHDEFYEPTGLNHPSYFLYKSDWRE
jgi:RimJ/RimL family protein N-acetyltransferase